MPELLFEIGCEEIPADAVPAAVRGFEAAARKRLEAERIPFEDLQVWTTPRRLTLAVRDLADSQTGAQEELTGPPWRVAFDNEGKPTKAAEGFAVKNGVKVKDLQKITTEKGEYVGVKRKLKAYKTVKLLPAILRELIDEIPFPKSMRWSDNEVSFVRPVHWIVALFDGKKVKVEFAKAKSGNRTRGHRFLAPKAFAVDGIDDYLAKLREAFVVVNQNERQTEIRKQVEALAAERGGRVIPEERLFEEVTHLVEWPVALAGKIEDRFLEIPRDVIVTSMRDHQRYFSIEDGEGKLLPYFITVSNMKVPDPEVVLSGNRRVLAARLSDAVFFVREDLKVPLADRTAELKTIVFQAKLGTSYEKYERFAKLARDFNFILKVVDEPKLDRAALLAKADLTTGMVGEFPELQGAIGAEYARRQGEDPQVAAAVEEHYMPRGADDDVPQGDLGALLGMADKMDTVVGCFGVGLIPSGTADPYALRRNALGILRILLDKRYALLIDQMIDLSLDLNEPKITRPRDDVRAAVLQFFRGRFENFLRGRGMLPDEIEAVLARGFTDAVDLVARIEALHSFRDDEAFGALAAAFKRAANIVNKELGDRDAGDVHPERFQDEAERVLWEQLSGSEADVKKLFAERKYADALRVVSGFRKNVDDFFDKVLVNAPEAEVKQNRLALLARLRALFDSFADFTKLSG